MPSVSIIVPVYNTKQFLPRCIESIVGQSLKDIEAIFVNDGSTDGSDLVLSSYASKDPRIRVITKQNQGVSAARNDGIRAARGEYLFFADSDDWLEQDGLEKMLDAAKRHRSDVLSADFYMDDGASATKKQLFPSEFSTTNAAVLSAMQNAILYSQPSAFSSPAFSHVNSFGGAAWHHLIKRSLVEEYGLSFNSYLDGMLEDGFFMLSVFERAHAVAYIQSPTYHYRVSPTSSTHRYLPDFERLFDRVIEQAFSFKDTYCKGDDFEQAIYMRQVSFVNKACEVCFLHPDNPSSRKDRYLDFKRFVQSEGYRRALENVDCKLFIRKQTRVQVRLLEQKLYWLFWTIKQRRIR